MRSPKCKYSASINFVDALKDADTITSDNLEELKHLVSLSAQGLAAHVSIKDNRKTYPEFEWVEIDSYNINEQ